MSDSKKVIVNAIKSVTRSNRITFCFCVDAKEFVKFASVTQAHRNNAFELEAYQRPEVRGHIQEIAEYLRSSDALLPNSIVIALTPDCCTFTQYERQSTGIGAIGELTISHGPERPAAFVIDGQQRTMALRQAAVENFPIFVTAIFDADVAFQRQQFVNVNSVKPLPRALIHELLPYLSNVPRRYLDKALPATIAERLSTNSASPLFGLVKLSTGVLDEARTPVVEFNSLVSAISHVLKRKDGFISGKLRKPDERKVIATAEYLSAFWVVIRREFPDAWGRAPKESRLMHGVGIWAITVLADHIAATYRRFLTESEIAKEICLIRAFTAWTAQDGDWVNIDGIGTNISWNELENTVKDKNRLAAYLVRKWRISRATQLKATNDLR